MKKQSKRGGRREGAGRKPAEQPQRHLRVAATDGEYLQLLTLGARERTEILLAYLAREEAEQAAVDAGAKLLTVKDIA